LRRREVRTSIKPPEGKKGLDNVPSPRKIGGAESPAIKVVLAQKGADKKENTVRRREGLK